MNPLLDYDFLRLLNIDKNRVIYARIISLDQYEYPIEQIEGVVTAGSITIDGESAVRRICSLTLSAKNLNINNIYWSITTKVKIEIGLQNNFDSRYDNIIWFKQGIFILTDFKTTQTLNNYVINLSGKDKMCLLNGDISGNLPAPVIFDSYADNAGQNGEVDSTGIYNFYEDTSPIAALLQGFNDRYQTDYKFIRGTGKLLTLNYMSKNTSINETAQISFKVNPNDNDWYNLSQLAIKDPEKPKYYNINIGDSDIQGFQVRNCVPGDKFDWTIEQKVPITLIIQEMIHQFGQEKYSNIIIKDIEPYGLEMLDNNIGENFYLLHNGITYVKLVNNDTLTNNYELSLSVNDNSDKTIIIKDGIPTNIIFRKFVEEDDNSLINILVGSTQSQSDNNYSYIQLKNDSSTHFTVTPIYDKKVAGYGMTLLVYPDELKGDIGTSITSILDKIVNMLGDYEYFYDLNGQFVFQGKPAYIKTPWNGTIYLNNENYIDPKEISNRVAYTFDDALLTTQYQNTPNMNNIKNDFIIWGERNSGQSGIKFHARYAIDNIPLEYTDFNGYTWTANKKTFLSQQFQKKIASANDYQHIYPYPARLQNTLWWEVNDWGNYYLKTFNINLIKNNNLLTNYSQDFGTLNSLTNAFLLNTNENFVKTIALIFSDSKLKRTIPTYTNASSIYYCQACDLRVLNEGWEYDITTYNSATGMCNIINTLNPNKKFILSDGTVITSAFHPDYVTVFMYDPLTLDNLRVDQIDFLAALVEGETQNENGQYRTYAINEDVDWRELIHIMADDWYAHNHEDDYEINLRMNNSWPGLDINLYPQGRTGYEQYYLDFTSIGGPWQDLYNIYYIQYLYLNKHTELQNLNRYETIYSQLPELIEQTKDNFITEGSYKYWHKDVINNPSNLTFWFDFFQADQMGIGKFAVSVIGDRSKTIDDSAIKVIIYEDAPDVIYCTQSEYDYYKEAYSLKDGYVYIIISDELKNKMVRSIRARSAHDEADNMLYQYSYYNDTVNINSVPIYYLQPNTIISIKDELSQIIGYYVMNKINISLAYNGMMQISAIKSPERIY